VQVEDTSEMGRSEAVRVVSSVCCRWFDIDVDRRVAFLLTVRCHW
jgi:hypothetical protein